MKNTARDDAEIEPGELFSALFKRSWVILLCGVLAVALTLLACRFVVRPVYRSSTTVYVLSRESGGAAITYSDLQTAEQLTSDYEELIKSRFVLETVLADLDLDMTADELEETITVTSPAGTRMLEIAVENEDPYLARELAGRIREVSGKRIVEIMHIDAVSLVDEADLPDEPYKPDVRKCLLVAGAGGLFAGLVIAVVLILLNDSIQTPEDAERYLGLSVLGVIPEEQEKRRRRGLSFRMSESFKLLSANLLFCGENVRAIAVTSCTSDGEKTDITCNLASALAQSGKRVLLIDADLRRSVMMERLAPGPDTLGLSHLLSGQAKREEVLFDGENGVKIIFAGALPPNPAQLLTGSPFKSLIESMRTQFDYILVDTPPLGAVIDGALAAGVCDGALLVIRSGKVSRTLAREVAAQLEKAGCTVLGAVLSGVNAEKYKDRYARYFGGGYAGPRFAAGRKP